MSDTAEMPSTRACVPTQHELDQVFFAAFLITPGCVSAGLGNMPWMYLRTPVGHRSAFVQAEARFDGDELRVIFHIAAASNLDVEHAQRVVTEMGETVAGLLFRVSGART